MNDYIAGVRDAYDVANRARQNARKKVADRYRAVIEAEVDAEVAAVDRAVATTIEKHLKAGVPRSMLRRSLRTNDGEKFRHYMSMLDSDVRDLRRGKAPGAAEPTDPWYGTDDEGRLLIFGHPYTHKVLNRPEVVTKVTWGRGTVFFSLETPWSTERVRDEFPGKGYDSATPVRDDLANAIVKALQEDGRFPGTEVLGDPSVFEAEEPEVAADDGTVDWD